MLGNGGELAMLSDRADLDLESLVRNLPANFIPAKFVRTAQIVDARWADGRQAAWCGPTSAATSGALSASLPRTSRPWSQVTSTPTTARTPSTASVTTPTATSCWQRRTRCRRACRCTSPRRTNSMSTGASTPACTSSHSTAPTAWDCRPNADCTLTYLMALRRDGADTIDHVVDQRLDAKVLDMARKLNDRQLATLAFPSSDDVLSDLDLLMDATQRGDLEALFEHLRGTG